MSAADQMVEQVAAQVHATWMAFKKAAGVTSWRSESGEELMVPYAELSEAAKDLDRSTVGAVFAGIGAAGYELRRAASSKSGPAPAPGDRVRVTVETPVDEWDGDVSGYQTLVYGGDHRLVLELPGAFGDLEGTVTVEVLERSAVRACRKCGCTDARACPGGCSWVGADLCSACA